MNRNFDTEHHTFLDVEYYVEGLFLISTLNINDDKIERRNYQVPIFIMPNKSIGFTVFHYYSQIKIYNVDYHDLAFNKAMVMMNNSGNWCVFIPAEDMISDQQRIKIKSDLELSCGTLTNYFSDDSFIHCNDIFNANNLCFAYGTGVE